MADQTPERLAEIAAEGIAQATGRPTHDVAIVLGSGWAAVGERLGTQAIDLHPPDPYRDDAQSAKGSEPLCSGVPGQRRTLRSVLVEAEGPTCDPPGVAATPVRVLVFGSRTHLYEGLGVDAATHQVRTAAATGCRVVVLTNACGALDPSLPMGTATLISDHLNLTGISPLHGPQFVDLTDAYDPALRRLARSVDPSLREGVYAQFHGPQYETPAEVRMAGRLGADLVGMSTAVETIAARACAMRVLGLSLITNSAAGIALAPLSHRDVLTTARRAETPCAVLLAGILGRLVNRDIGVLNDPTSPHR